jgi:hypothetical protein
VDGYCASTALNCDDSNGCTTDYCDAELGCQNVPSDLPCDDGTLCTENDECDGGACGGTQVFCDDGNDCTDDSCSSTQGCQYSANTGACPDDDACTTNEQCAGGVCSAVQVVCDDGNPCTQDSCDGVAGCVTSDVSGGCDDDDACTENDQCTAGTCAGTALVCSDSEPCTDDSCHPVLGCQYTANTASCDDGDACTEGDHCAGGTCATTAVDCDDNDVCTTDTCVAASGCQWDPVSASCGTCTALSSPVLGAVSCGTVGGEVVFGAISAQSTGLMTNYACLPGDWDGAEQVYTYQPDVDGVVTVSAVSAEPLAVLVIQGTCAASNCLAAGQQNTSFHATLGDTYYLVVDATNVTAVTPYSLQVTCTPSLDVTCGNGVLDGTETDVDCGGGKGCIPCGQGATCVQDDDCIDDTQCLPTGAAGSICDIPGA